MDYKTIKYQHESKTGVIILNRPERMNAVNEEMYREIIDILNIINSNPDIRSIIITGTLLKKKNGTFKQAFCAGADLKKHSSGERDESAKRKYIELAHKVSAVIYNMPKPVIAAVNGPARGAGAEIALSADFLFIAQNASIAFPETGLGTFVGGGISKRLSQIVGLAKAKELIFTGKIINAQLAINYGIALESFHENDLLQEALSFSALLNKKAPHSLRLAKKLLDESYQKDIYEVLENETEAILSCMQTEDWHEGIKAFMEKRNPAFKGE